eukprot:8409218-Alexandrium_andersonii.AAC.1
MFATSTNRSHYGGPSLPHPKGVGVSLRGPPVESRVRRGRGCSDPGLIGCWTVQSCVEPPLGTALTLGPSSSLT